MGLTVQRNKAIVGTNAFALSSGIHQDGIIKDRSTYEIIRPEDVGGSAHTFTLTARSGRAALKHHITNMGHKLTDGQLDTLYEKFLHLADKKKEVMVEDLEIFDHHLLLLVRQVEEFLVEGVQLSVGELVPHVGNVVLEGRPTGSRGEGEGVGGPADILGADDLVGRAMLDDPVLVDAGGVRERGRP